MFIFINHITAPLTAEHYLIEYIVINQKQKNMEKILIIVGLFVCIRGIDAGQNIIQNGRFQQPNISGSVWQSFPSILGWNCSSSCQIQNCLLMSANCSGQMVDLSSNFIENISQTFIAQKDIHIFQLTFLLPFYFANSKTLLVYLNEVLIYSYTPQVASDNISYSMKTYVYTLEGTNNLRFTISGRNDNCGFNLVSVSLRQLQIKYSSIANIFISNDPFRNIISFPGSRFLLGELVNLFISFDRLQLYYYHNRNYSYQLITFLKAISNFMDAKASFSLQYQKYIFGGITQQERFIDQCDFKYNYTNQAVLDRSQNGYGFISNNHNLIVYSLPFFVLISAFLFILFKIIFKYRISKLIRKYQFFGTAFLLMICEGNIEQFSFYFFGELGNFFSSNFRHKIVNSVIVLFFFVVVFCSTALYLVFWSRKKRQTWCFVENTKLKLGGVLSYTLNRGLFCLILGALHQTLIYSPNKQLLALGLCESIWIISQIIGLVYQIYECRLIVWLNIIEGLLRMGFQLASYLYANVPNGFNPTISIEIIMLNKDVHLMLILSFFLIWILQFIVCLWLAFGQLVPSKKHKKRKKGIRILKKNAKINITVFYQIFRKGKLRKQKLNF